MTSEPDKDGVFRCTTPGCSKTWLADIPENRIPILRSPNGTYVCSGCPNVYKTARLLQAHYGSRKDQSHTGKMCIATPRNLLSRADFKEYTQHLETPCLATKRTLTKTRKASQRASTLQRLLGTSVDKSGWSKSSSAPNSNTANVSQHDSISKDSHSDSSRDVTDTTSDLQDEAQASYWSTWHHKRGFGSTYRVSSETGTDSSCSSHASPPASPSAPETMSPVSSDAVRVGAGAVSGQNTHAAAVILQALDGVPDGGMPASVLPAVQDQEGPCDAKAPATAQCDIAQLPLQYQPCVLVQAYKYGLVSWQDLQQASTSTLYPQILIGDESTKLVMQIKRKVARNNHADKVASMSQLCEIYHRFNGRVDELLKPGRSPEGLWKYQNALCMEREAAGQCMLWLQS